MANAGMANTTMQYGQMGYQVGGVYGAVIGAIIGAVTGYRKERQAIQKVNKYNQAILANAVDNIFVLQREQNLVNQQTSQALYSYQDAANVHKASYTAQYGAADMIGSSGAAALNQVLDYQTKQAQANVWMNWGSALDAHNAKVQNIVNTANSKFLQDIPDDGSSSQQGGQMMGQGMGMLGGMMGGGGQQSSSGGMGASMSSGYNYGSLSNVYSGSGSMGSTSYDFGMLSNVYSTG